MDRDQWVDSLARWAETYGDPEEWAQKAKAAHARAEKAEARVRVLEKALEYLADPESWGGNPLSQESTLYGHDTPFELAAAALASEGTPEETS
jgi:hypothetical protein